MSTITLTGGPHHGETRTATPDQTHLVEGAAYYTRTGRTTFAYDPNTRQGTLTPTGTDSAMIRKAAAIYRAAGLAGMPPTQTVSRALSVSTATAGRLIARARNAGHLPPAVNGRATFADSAHTPRAARWSSDSESWRACAACKHPWPCPAAMAEHADEIGTPS